MATNWDDYGIAWEASIVRRQDGGHATDRRPLGNAQIPRLTDLDKAKSVGLGDAILAGINGTSWRVKAQDVSRRALEKNAKIDVEVLRERVYNRLRAMRSVIGATTITKEIVIHTLPDGTLWTDDMGGELEFRQEAIAMYTDMEIPVETAQKLAANLKW